MAGLTSTEQFQQAAQSQSAAAHGPTIAGQAFDAAGGAISTVFSETAKGISHVRNNTSDGADYMGWFVAIAGGIVSFSVLNAAGNAIFGPASGGLSGALRSVLLIGGAAFLGMTGGEMMRRGGDPLGSVMDTAGDWVGAFTDLLHYSGIDNATKLPDNIKDPSYLETVRFVKHDRTGGNIVPAVIISVSNPNGNAPGSFIRVFADYDELERQKRIYSGQDPEHPNSKNPELAKYFADQQRELQRMVAAPGTSLPTVRFAHNISSDPIPKNLSDANKLNVSRMYMNEGLPVAVIEVTRTDKDGYSGPHLSTYHLGVSQLEELTETNQGEAASFFKKAKEDLELAAQNNTLSLEAQLMQDQTKSNAAMPAPGS